MNNNKEIKKIIKEYDDKLAEEIELKEIKLKNLNDDLNKKYQTNLKIFADLYKDINKSVVNVDTFRENMKSLLIALRENTNFILDDMLKNVTDKQLLNQQFKISFDNLVKNKNNMFILTDLEKEIDYKRYFYLDEKNNVYVYSISNNNYINSTPVLLQNNVLVKLFKISGFEIKQQVQKNDEFKILDKLIKPTYNALINFEGYKPLYIYTKLEEILNKDLAFIVLYKTIQNKDKTISYQILPMTFVKNGKNLNHHSNSNLISLSNKELKIMYDVLKPRTSWL